MGKIREAFTRKKMDYEKELYRGTIKQVMKVRGLRAINLHNYRTWKSSMDETLPNTVESVHSIKLDIQDGYINAYASSKSPLRCGDKIENVSAEDYSRLFSEVNAILADESRIPSKARRNIMVKVCR